MESRARAARAHAALSGLLSGPACAALVEALVAKYVALSAEELEEWRDDPESYARWVRGARGKLARDRAADECGAGRCGNGGTTRRATQGGLRLAGQAIWAGEREAGLWGREVEGQPGELRKVGCSV